MPLRALPLVLALAVAQLAPAQKPESAPSGLTEGMQALAAVRATFEKTPAWSCLCVSNLGAVPFSGMGARLSTIWRHDAEGNLTGLRATGTFNDGPNVDAATDGVVIRVVDPDKKVYEEGPWAANAVAAAGAPPATEAGIVGLLRFALPIELWQRGGLERGKNGGVFLKGTKTLDGVSCDVIELHQKFDVPGETDPSKGAGSVTSIIAGHDDRLIRQIRKRFISPGVSMVSTDAESVYDFTEWKPAADVTDATFTIDVTGAQPGRIPLPKGVKGGAPKQPGRPPGLPRVGVKKGDRLADFSLKDLSGKEYKLSSQKGKVVFVHFTIPQGATTNDLLTRLKSKHGAQLVIFELLVDRSGASVDELKKMMKPASFPRLVGGEKVAESWGVESFPCGVTIGPDGKVASTLMTGIAQGSGADFILDSYLRRMGEYLKNPEKGW